MTQLRAKLGDLWKLVDRELSLNFIFGIAGKFGALLSVLIVAPVAAKKVGAEEFGVYVSLLPIVTWVTIFDFGFGNAIQNRLVAATEVGNIPLRNGLIRLLWYRTIIIGIILAAVLVAIAFTPLPWVLAGRPATLRLSYIKQSYLLMCGCLLTIWSLGPLRTLSYVDRKTYSWNVFSLVSSIVYIATVWGLQNRLESVRSLALCSFVSTLCAAAAFVIMQRDGLRLGDGQKLSPDELGPLLRTSFGFFILQILGAVMYQMDIVLVSNFASPQESARYYVLQRLTTTSIVLWSLVLQPIWPTLSRYWVRREIDAFRRSVAALRIGALSLGLVLLAVYPGSSRILFAFYRSSPIELTAGLLVCVGVLSAVRLWVDAWATINNAITVMSTQVRSGCAQFIIFVLASIFFIPRYGSYGVLAAHILALLCAPAWMLPRRIRAEIFRKFGHREPAAELARSKLV